MSEAEESLCSSNTDPTTQCTRQGESSSRTAEADAVSHGSQHWLDGETLPRLSQRLGHGGGAV